MTDIPLTTQFHMILQNREPHLISTEALHIARMAVLAERTHWSYKTLCTLPEDIAIDLATFYAIKDTYDRSQDRTEKLLDRIGDKLEALANAPTPEIVSWTTQKRLRLLLEVLLGPEYTDDGAEDTVPNNSPLERWLERSFTR